MWLAAVALALALTVWSFYVGRVAGRFLTGVAGTMIGALLFVYALGGHISAHRWWLGGEGERDTAQQIEKLGSDWHREHDVEHEHGNWDHVLVGPAGVFLLDSKRLSGTAAVGADALRSGRIVYPGVRFRASAKRVKVELERRLGFRAPWVQAVVVVWGEFPQECHELENVVYVQGEQLVAWLSRLREKVTATQRAAYITALQEVRTSLTITRDVSANGGAPSPASPRRTCTAGLDSRPPRP
ncbi:MAG: nuclease-related domain-containing protein [Gaiellaceae bacterium]